jgi:hypothetical protein
MYDDFEKLALETYKKGNLYGLEKYWYVTSECSSTYCETVTARTLASFCHCRQDLDDEQSQ